MFSHFLKILKEVKIEQFRALEREIALIDQDIAHNNDRIELKKRNSFLPLIVNDFPAPNGSRHKNIAHDATMNSKYKKISENLPHLQQQYFSTKKGAPLNNDSSKFSKVLNNFTMYNTCKKIVNIQFVESVTSTIVSSVEFNKDEELFATAGVNNKILRVYEYKSISDSEITFPKREMPSISNIR
jgi:hypothetical protein